MATSAKLKSVPASPANPKAVPAANKPSQVVDVKASAKAIVDRFKALNATAKEYYRELHSALTDALSHTFRHGDSSLMTTCFSYIHGATNKRAVQMWVQRYSNLVWRKTDKGELFKKAEGKKFWIKGTPEESLKEAKEHPFWNLPEVQAIQRPLPAIDVDGRIASVIRLIDRAVHENRIKGATQEERDRALGHFGAIKEFAEKELGIEPDQMIYKAGEQPKPAEDEKGGDSQVSEGEAKAA